jgi:hypothetical protein
MPRNLLVSLALLLPLAAGCAANRPFRLMTPGTVEQKRQRATVHDPYPDQNLGPEVVGGRPRDYQEPLPEAVKNRLYVDSVLGGGPG